MTAILVVLYVFVCMLLIGAVLIQQGKGSGMGALTGAGQTWFGPAGSKTVLMKITLGLAGVFLVLAILLTLTSTRRPVAPPPPEVPSAPAAPAAPAK
jgi:preprotein translocase subunit SecG